MKLDELEDIAIMIKKLNQSIEHPDLADFLMVCESIFRNPNKESVKALSEVDYSDFKKCVKQMQDTAAQYSYSRDNYYLNQQLVNFMEFAESIDTLTDPKEYYVVEHKKKWQKD